MWLWRETPEGAKHSPGSRERRGLGGSCTYLSKVVKVVLLVYPLVIGSHTVRPVGDVTDVNPEAVVELPLEEL